MNSLLQYLINTSTIWLLSLLVFDMILKKETFHTYNRAYLLLTFVLGLLIPLWQWPQNNTVYHSTANFSTPIRQQSIAVHETIVNSNAAATMISLQDILTGIYLCGVAVFALLLVKELVSLMITYRKGDRSKDGVWKVVETGKQHSPYSAFRVVFISSKQDYTPEQLRIILTHEEQHGHLLHFFDLLLMQAAKVVLWFHPLVYLYAERLAIVHEYQADAAVDKEPKEYGMFLIEQSILGTAPALSHSFNRSPIKKRILMLTRHSSAFAKSKTLIVLPLMVICLLCCTKNTLVDNTRTVNGNKVTYRGNVVELAAKTPDTLTYTDPKTGVESKVTMVQEPGARKPITLNGEKIYDAGTFSQYATAKNATNYVAQVTYNEINVYLLDNLKEELKALKDGNYYLQVSDVVIDNIGKIVFFNTGGVATCYRNNAVIGRATQADFVKHISSLLDEAPAYAPAIINDKKVAFLIEDLTLPGFTVKEGKLTAILN